MEPREGPGSPLVTWTRSLGLCLSGPPRPQAADPTGLGAAPHQEPRKLPGDAGGGRGRSTDRPAHSTAHGDPTACQTRSLSRRSRRGAANWARACAGEGSAAATTDRSLLTWRREEEPPDWLQSPHPGWTAHTSSPTRPSAPAGRPRTPQCPATAGPREQHATGTGLCFPRLGPNGVLWKQERLRSESAPFVQGPWTPLSEAAPLGHPNPIPPAAPTPPRLAGSASERGWGGVERSLCPAGAPSKRAGISGHGCWLTQQRTQPRGEPRPPAPGGFREGALLARPGIAEQGSPPAHLGKEGRVQGGKVPLGPGTLGSEQLSGKSESG